MVDTGSQSTVISCAMLYKIGKHMRFQGKDFKHADLIYICMEKEENMVQTSETSQLKHFSPLKLMVLK